MAFEIKISQPEGEKIGTQISELIQVLHQIDAHRDDHDVLLDVSGVVFIRPVLALGLSALIDNLRTHGYSTEVGTPKNEYLKTIFFPEGYSPVNAGDWENVLNQFQGKSFIPVIKLPTDYSLAIVRNNLLSKVNSLLRSRLNLSFEEYEAVSYLISEMTDNITDHSGEQHGWLFAQFYPAAGFIDICIADTGRAFLGSYQEKNMAGVSTHAQAIQKALQGISTKGKERGFGIPTVRDMIMNGMHGTFVILSGNALLVNDQFTELPETWNGSLLALRIPQHIKGFDFYKYIG